MFVNSSFRYSPVQGEKKIISPVSNTILGEDRFCVDSLGSPFQSYRMAPGARLLPKAAAPFFSSLTSPLPNQRPVVFFSSLPQHHHLQLF